MTADNTVDDRLEQAIARIMKQITADVPDAALAMGVARATGYQAVKAGEWPSIKVMGRIKIPTRWLREQLMLDEPPQRHIDTAARRGPGPGGDGPTRWLREQLMLDDDRCPAGGLDIGAGRDVERTEQKTPRRQ